MKIAGNVFIILTCVVLLTAPSAQAASDAALKALWQRAEQGEYLTPAEKAELSPFARDMERRNHEAIDATGGPDGYGYYFVDNQNGDSTTYSWIELRGDDQATWVDFEDADDGTASIPLTFYFPFYGVNHTALNVCTNGFITFNDVRSAAFNSCLPASSLGGPAIAMFWDDLHLHYGGNNQNDNTVAWRDFGDYIVIQYDEIGHYGFPTPPNDHFTFECILYSNGGIKLQYQTMVYDQNENSQTIGIQQNTNGTQLEYTCNSGSPQNGYAVWFYRGGYGSLMGTVTAGGQPVYRATVWLEQANLYATTDGNGTYVFPIAPVGTYSVTARMFGYTQHERTVTVQTNQWANFGFALSPMPVVNFSADNVDLTIPDRDTVYAHLNVTDNVVIEDCAVQIENLTHTYVGDLILWLESPWGERVELSNRNGGSGDNMQECQLDDIAGQSIANGIAPFSGRYWPESELASLAGNPSRGTWTLVCYDAANQDQGVLQDWSLHFTGAQVPEGRVWGFVRTEDGSGIHSCHVTCSAAGQNTVTDAEGFWELYLPVGSWNIEFEATGYCGYEIEEYAMVDNANAQRNVVMGTAEGHASVTQIVQEVAGQGTFTQTFNLVNSGDCNWSYSIDVLAENWLSVSPESGNLPWGGSDEITVTFNSNGLVGGLYYGELEVSHNGTSGRITIPVTLDVATAATPTPSMPETYALRGNYPNPFNGQTEIAFELPTASNVTITVHNLLGQQVATVLNETRAAGYHSVNWTARTTQGQELTTGLYFLRVNMGGRDYVSKMVLAR